MILLLFIFIVPGIIAVKVNNLINKTESMKISALIIAWSIFSFLIVLANYTVLFFIDNNDVITLTANEGSDIYRVGFVFKFTLLSLILSIGIPCVLFVLKRFLMILKPIFTSTIRRARKAFVSKQRTQDDTYIESSVNFFLNLPTDTLHKISALRDRTLLRKGQICIYSPIYPLKPYDNDSIVVSTSEQGLIGHNSLGNDSLIIISNDPKDIRLVENFSEFIFLSNKKFKGVADSNLALLPLYSSKNITQKMIENHLLQSMLVFTLR